MRFKLRMVSGRVRLALVLGAMGCLLAACFPPTPPVLRTSTLGCTGGGAAKLFHIPQDVHTVGVDIFGAQGGTYNGSVAGGQGGEARATLVVTPGDTLALVVGCKGADTTPSSGTGGAGGASPVGPNGGNGGNGVYAGAGGGGGSAVYYGAERVVAGGGGGGAGQALGATAGAGGSGGGGTSALATPGGSAGPFLCVTGGMPGTDSATGLGGTVTACTAASRGVAGSLGGGVTPFVGGNGASTTFQGGGGGGGGWNGGGGGAGSDGPDHTTLTGAGGGGGGAGLCPLNACTLQLAGKQSGDGMIVVSYVSAFVAVIS